MNTPCKISINPPKNNAYSATTHIHLERSDGACRYKSTNKMNDNTKYKMRCTHLSPCGMCGSVSAENGTNDTTAMMHVKQNVFQ